MLPFNSTLINMQDITLANSWQILKPLSLFVLGVVIYSIFIFKFYRFLGKKNIFDLDLKQYNIVEHAFLKKTVSVIFYILEHIIIFPLFIFFWFAIITLLLIFLSKNQDVQNVLLISITLVSAIRITAYYKQALSMDLAKMMPFALLGVFLVDIGYFSFDKSMEALKQVITYSNTLIYYLMFVIILEFSLRIVYHILKPLRPGYAEEDN